ncbi:hypothetical protein NQD34_008720 [Periophthalmus magnuspinnatus]|nr:hypothetical protein NQD34_008720 [Periophthalmus magnuspinnatus]
MISPYFCLSLQNLMAKALYDNVPESPEELAFRKGDILTVIEQNTGGLEGWWLCSLHGRQGIAPGNRLKLLIGPMFEAPSPLQSSSQSSLVQSSTGGPSPSPHTQAQVQGSGATALYQAPLQSPQQSVYQVPPRSALSVDNTPNKVGFSSIQFIFVKPKITAAVVTPSRVGQSYSFSPGQNLQDLYDVPPSRAQGSVYDVPPSQLEPWGGQGVYDIPPPAQGVYSVPPCRTTSNHQEANYDFPQPMKSAKVEGVYDIPPPALTKPTQISSQSVYDYPSPPSNPESSSSSHSFHNNNDEGVYAVPPPALASSKSDIYDIPRGQVPSRGSPSDSKGIYDVPVQDSRVNDVTDGVNRLSFSSTGSTRSSMSTSSSSTGGVAEGRLVLDLDSALQRLYRLQQNVEVAVGNLHTMAASPHWRTVTFMERHANDVRTVLDRVRAAVADFVVFGRGAAANATALSDCSLHSKLKRQLARLEDSQQIVIQIYQVLDQSGWAVSALAASTSVRHNKTDEVERFVMVSRTVPDDAKQLASTISTNAEVLFRRSHTEGSPDEMNPALSSPPSDNESYRNPLSTTNLQDKDNRNHSEQCVKSWMEDYDYVHLQGKEDFERQQKALLDKENIIKQNQEQLGQEQQRFCLTPNVTPKKTDSSSSASPAAAGPSPQLCSRDKQLLVFYWDQCEQHLLTLLSAMDAFFSCVSSGQPPRIFVAHSKFVILSAHKLVFIGDTLSRQVSTPELANRVMNASNVLCDLLKTVVGATKMAAMSYPNTAAVQEMVDRVTQLSQHSQHFKEQLRLMSTS